MAYKKLKPMMIAADGTRYRLVTFRNLCLVARHQHQRVNTSSYKGPHVNDDCHALKMEELTGSNYSDDELELLKAVEKYKRDKRVKFPSCVDILNIVKSLGYVKPVKVSGA